MCALGSPGYSGEPLGAPRPFAGDDERDRQQRAQRDAHAGAEQPRLDRVAHQEDAAERQRDGADPDRPLGAEPFLQAHCRRGWPRRCGGFRRGRCGRLGRNGFVRSDRLRVWRRRRFVRDHRLRLRDSAPAGRRRGSALLPMPCGGATAPAPAAISLCSSAMKRWSSTRRRLRLPTDITSATMATTGSARIAIPSKTKKPSISRPSQPTQFQA